jgi:uncharacterized protein
MSITRLFKLIVKDRINIYKIALIAFTTINFLTYLVAYNITHLHSPGEFSFGISRPINTKLPSDFGLKYKTDRISIAQSEWLETWLIPARNSTSKGTVLLFPGNLVSKSNQLITVAQVFHQLDYDSLLVDFRGVGGSSGNTTTLGWQEAQDVASVMEYVRKIDRQRPIILYGVSMGSVAILTAIAREKIKPDAIVLELPYARLIDAVRSRVINSYLPTFPISELLVFWGGLQHGFNGFDHNPVDYARQVKCPTLLLHGKQDRWTSITEINEIFNNINAKKQLITFDRSGHNLLASTDKELWKQSVEKFLNTISIEPITNS